MSSANVYRFFDSKKAINEAVADRLIGQVDAALERIADTPGVGASERLRCALRALHLTSVELFTHDLRMHEMVEAAISESWGIVHGHILRTDAVFRRIVADGVASGEFATSDPVAAARCINAAMIRFCHPTIMLQCVDEPGPTIDQMCDFVLAGLQSR